MKGDDKFLREIGERVSARRKELHLTQEAVAEQMNVSVQMISNLEVGRKAIRPENLLKLCQTLQISADYLLTGISTDRDCTDLAKRISSLPVKQQRVVEQLINSLCDL